MKTHSSAVFVDGDPNDIRPKNRRERRIKASLIRGTTRKGLSTAPRQSGPHNPDRAFIGKKLKP